MSGEITLREGNMKNVSFEVSAENILTITVDLNQSFGPSASGKSVIIATTEGNASLEGDSGIKIGLNVYRKA